jgi:DNA-binding NtrC family response regulator
VSIMLEWAEELKAEPPTDRAPRILVVDDEPEIQEIMGELLKEVGYDVETASSPEQALAAVARHPYDLVISDLRLPGCSGIKLAEEIVRQRPDLAKRIVLVTGELNAAPGWLPIIHKPFDLDVILNVVHEQLTP